MKDNSRIGKMGLIIYDGSCGACTLFIEERKSFFEHYGFSVAPLQEQWVKDFSGIEDSALLESIHLITPDKKVLREVDFFCYLTSKVWWLSPISFVLKIPFFKKAFAKFYNYIAKRRKNISRACGLQSRAKYKL